MLAAHLVEYKEKKDIQVEQLSIILGNDNLKMTLYIIN